MKLYRYRPATELVFKELRYCELYLATQSEINDPLDLDAQLNFFQRTEDEAFSLARFLQLQAVITHGIIRRGPRVMQSVTVERLASFFIRRRAEHHGDFVSKSEFFEALREFYAKYVEDANLATTIDAEELIVALDERFRQFLCNSAVVCFSARPDDFLMWSYYAGGHGGICLEFEVETNEPDAELAHLAVLGYSSLGRECIPWKEEIRRVEYGAELPRINFADFLPVFANAGDIDLMNLSKSHWHPYAEVLRMAFLAKLEPWSYEREWRIVDVSFKPASSEERILNYNPTALTGVYYGARASGTTRRRVEHIVCGFPNPPKRYECRVNGGRELKICEVGVSPP